MKEFLIETLPASNHSGTLRMPIFVSSCRQEPSLQADILKGKRLGPARKLYRSIKHCRLGVGSRKASPLGAGCQPQLSWQSGRAPALPAGTCSNEPWAPQSCFWAVPLRPEIAGASTKGLRWQDMGSPLQGLGLSAQLQGVKSAASQALMPQTAREKCSQQQAHRWQEVGGWGLRHVLKPRKPRSLTHSRQAGCRPGVLGVPPQAATAAGPCQLQAQAVLSQPSSGH